MSAAHRPNFHPKTRRIASGKSTGRRSQHRMSTNPFKKLVKTQFPAVSLGLDGGAADVAVLDRRRQTYVIRRAASIELPEGLLQPSFHETNIADQDELSATLLALVTDAELTQQKRWSVAVPEVAARTMIIALETTPASHGELEEMLRWKTERSFGAALEEMQVSRQLLPPDAQGRTRYLVTAMRSAVLAEYEAVFARLGWHAGLVLPRHIGEAWWLMKDTAATDSLLVSGHNEGFTAMLLRRGQPLLVRSVVCDRQDQVDELHRFLLFYQQRVAAPVEEGQPELGGMRLLIAGAGLDQHEVSAVVSETLAVTPHTLDAEDLRLVLPSDNLDFHRLIAPAGLAALAWD